MSAIFDLIEREQNKLARRRDALAASKVEADVLGTSPKLANKIARQEQAIKESEAALKKLNAAAK